MDEAVSGGIPDGLSRVVVLAAGDILLVLVFVVLGELRHGVDPVGKAGRVVSTTLPFVMGWLIAASIAGLYTGRRGPIQTALRTAIAWTAAAGVGVGLRATPHAPGGFDTAFLLVAIGVGVVLLIPWRIVAAAQR